MRGAIALGAATVVLAIAAASWTPVVLPKLEQLPADFDTEVDVTGTFELQAAPGTLARLPQPLNQPLAATLAIKTVTTSGDNLVISQVATQKVGPPSGPTQDLVLNSQYVVNRRTAQNVNDPQAWSISPNHPVNREGTYSFTFGFDFDPNGTYPLWDDSIGGSYPLKKGGSAGNADTGGLTVTGTQGTTTNAPADPVWIAALAPLQLPKALTPEQWAAAGFTVSRTQPEVNTSYFVSIQTQVSIDNLTGGTANLTNQTVNVSVAPDPAATGETPAPPQTVFINSYSETPQSVTNDTSSLADDGKQLTLAKTTIPRILIGLTILFALAAIVVFTLGRRRSNRAADASEG